MSDKIVVGILVGLVIGSSLYIWNSENFTKPQKYILLAFIIFPPLQWISILLLLAYNKYQSENTIEAKTIKQNVESKQNLDSAKNNLKELKEKGIITEEEFNSKVDKIESQKTEFDIKNSTEYKQLKSLLDSGILTTEEFENKIKLIKKEPIKKVSKEESERLNQYIENIKLQVKEEPKKESSTFMYVIAILFFAILIGVTLINANLDNNSIKEEYDSPPAPTIDTTASYNNTYKYQEPIKIKKFVYIVIKVEKPKLDVYESIGYTNTFGNYIIPDPTYSIDFVSDEYTTEIIEIENYNEDEKYKAIDKAKNTLQSQLSIENSVFQSNLWVKCKDSNKREEFSKLKSTIKDTKIYEFNNYSEASIHKQNNFR